MPLHKFRFSIVLTAAIGLSGTAWSGPIIPGAEPLAKAGPGRPEIAPPPPRTSNEPVPEAALPYAQEAEEAVRRGDLPAAQAALDAAIAAFPEAGALYFARARLHARQQKGNEAIADYEKGLSLAPKSIEARLELADLLAQRLNQPERALRYYREAVKLAPDNAAARYGLAFGLVFTKQTDEAIRELQEAQRLAPDNPMPAIALSQIYARAQRYSEALRASEDALRRRPDHAPALITKADILLAMRRFNDAAAAYEAALAIDPSLAPAQLGLAMAQDAAGRNAEAEQSYRRVLQSNPKQVLALNGLAVLLTNRNANLDEAVDLARQAVALAGEVAEFRDTLGWALHRSNQPGAIEELERSIAIRPMAITYVHLGAVHKAAGQTEAARQAYREALKLDPNYAPARTALGALSTDTPAAR